MKFKLLGLVVFLASSASMAGEYQCRVHCKSPDGQTQVTVKAGSASEAASIVDKQGHQVCKSAGHARATESTMTASQCSSK